MYTQICVVFKSGYHKYTTRTVTWMCQGLMNYIHKQFNLGQLKSGHFSKNV